MGCAIIRGMGRHARGAARSGITTSTIVLGTLIVAVVAVGSWMGSRAQPTPIAATEVNGSALVVSSLACNDGTGGTLVDVQTATGGPIRASIDACGHQEGELLAVRYPVSDPAEAWIANQDPRGDAATDGPLLPIGLGIAALLGLLAVLAVWLDGRRSGRSRAPRPPAAHEEHDENTPEPYDPLVVPRTDLQSQAPRPVAPAMEPQQRAGRHSLPEPVEIVVPADTYTEDRRLSSVDLVFPFTSSLAASLHDELFTHRGVTT